MRLSLVLDISKAVVAMYVGVFCVLVSYNNVIDYNTNFQFVQHVLAMDQMKAFLQAIICMDVRSLLRHFTLCFTI